jgi:IclR family mhp operon transcriptional activator
MTAMANVSNRRPVVRALDLLVVLNRRPVTTIHELHADTGWPKSTIHRILENLIVAGFVLRDEVKCLYRLTAKVRELSGGFGEDCLVTDVGAEILRRVTLEIQWPLAIGTRQGLEMVVRYSTMPYSPLAVKPTTTANRHPLLTSAMGTAYLAYCPPDERAFLLEALRRSNRGDATLAQDAAGLQTLLDRVAERGYGVRLAKTRSNGSSVAVPIFADSHLAGVLSMTVFATLLDEVLTRFLGVLRDTAGEISQRLATLGLGHTGVIHAHRPKSCARPVHRPDQPGVRPAVAGCRPRQSF